MDDTNKFLDNIGVDKQNKILGNCLKTVCDGLFHLFYG